MNELARGWEAPEAEVSAGEGLAEGRSSPRVTVLIRPGKLIVDGREYLCVVRDVSNGGLKVRLFQPLPSHRTLAIEFDTGERHAVRLVWQAEGMAGFEFVDAVDVTRLIAVQDAHRPRRQPRLHVDVEAVLCSAGLRVPVMLRDISQRGASVECSGWLMIDELVRIECKALPTLHAKVRWRRPPRYGLVFEQTFRLEELAIASARLGPREPVS